MTDISSKILKIDGQMYRVFSDGKKELIKNTKQPLRRQPKKAEVFSDASNIPLDEKDFEELKPVPRVRIIRRALMLTQEEFASQFHIPIGTLRDWEQGRTEPDQAAKSFLEVIAAEPEMVKRALEKSAA